MLVITHVLNHYPHFNHNVRCGSGGFPGKPLAQASLDHTVSQMARGGFLKKPWRRPTASLAIVGSCFACRLRSRPSATESASFIGLADSAAEVLLRNRQSWFAWYPACRVRSRISAADSASLPLSISQDYIRIEFSLIIISSLLRLYRILFNYYSSLHPFAWNKKVKGFKLQIPNVLFLAQALGNLKKETHETL